MRNLVALKFNAGLHTDSKNGHKIGHAKYPDFNQVSLATRKGMDWCNYIDTHGIGMQYDKGCGHKEEGDTRYGEQSCVVAVLQDFATEALALFPTELTQLTPVEFETFYNDKAHAHEPADNIDQDVMDAIKVKEDLAIAVPEKVNAIDRNHPDRGIRKNDRKTWSDYKAKVGVAIV
jgi:hypothetical protein